jgi:predicted dehydrogenase
VGTQQRSGVRFRKATELVRQGALGKVTFCRTFNYGNGPAEGIGNPPDTVPPGDLDWNMWPGPAPERPFNKNRFGVDPDAYSHFRWFRDYAGGMMTDGGVHVLDIVQMAFDETPPKATTAPGGKYLIKDNRDTPDTLQVTYEYPNGMLAMYENRMFNGNSLFGKSYGTIFHGGKRNAVRGSRVIRYGRKGEFADRNHRAELQRSRQDHWSNFISWTRQRPVSDIEIGYRSTATALPRNRRSNRIRSGNTASRGNLECDADSNNTAVSSGPARVSGGAVLFHTGVGPSVRHVHRQ